MLRPTDRLHFFTSPYRRTRETADGILETLTSDDDPSDPSPFRREEIKVYEEPRLREQDFGNFQPCGAEMERMWQERADYGHFFYRIPNGESAADAYDRVSGFNESLWRQFGEDDFADVCVLGKLPPDLPQPQQDVVSSLCDDVVQLLTKVAVTHGLMSRVFLMKWYHFTVEYFEDLRNINHCEFLIMRKNEDTGKYILENKLRTWSELRKERKELGDTNGNGGAPERDAARLSRSKTFISLRRWGGCPNGCNHRREYKRREDLETLRLRDEANGDAPLTLVTRRKQRAETVKVDGGAVSLPAAPHIDVTRTETEEDEELSSPDGTPSFISAEDRLRSLRSPLMHIGRDGGGTYSGHASLSGSDDESSDEGRNGKERIDVVLPGEEPGGGLKAGKYVGESGMGRGAMAHRLGDNSDEGSREGSPRGSPKAEIARLERLEREEKSVRGSVY